MGLWLAFVGTLLMIPESIRLTRKNPEGAISFASEMRGARYTSYLQTIGLVFLCIGLFLQAYGAK
jgi:hypothetical protein